METKVTIERFKELLPLICDKETSSDPEYWTPENPLWGHCAVVTLIAKNLFGGEPMRAPIAHITKFARMRTHYWNRISIGKEYDFTAPQFGDDYPYGLVAEQSTRQYILYDPKTGKPREIMSRYKLLAYRLVKVLSDNNPLFDDPIYKRCFYAALDSPCQKMKFGCVLRHYYDCERIGVARWEEVETCNKTIEPLRSSCEPTCIRLNIPSRTESMRGACGHAEELALWEAVKKFIPVGDSEMYVAGLYNNCSPYIKSEPIFTCPRCAVQIYLSGIRKVYVPVIDHWEELTGEECVKTARAYETGDKKV